jgi:hypothetical protein
MLLHAIDKSNIPSKCTDPLDIQDCVFSSYFSTLKDIGATTLYKKVKNGLHREGRVLSSTVLRERKQRKCATISCTL